MIPIAICDDELLHARQTQAAIRRCEAQAVTRCFETPLALLAAVTQQGYAPRVAVLDIRMAGMDGIELAKRLNALVPGCAVIFLTAYLSYAPDVYETRHVYFVLKNELDRRIGSALRAALAETAAPASLQLATAHGYRNVPVTDVLFLERILRKTRVVLTDGDRRARRPAGSRAGRCLPALPPELLGEFFAHHRHGEGRVRPDRWPPRPHQPQLPQRRPQRLLRQPAWGGRLG